jgi:signal transduction histidine kinase
MGPDDRIEILEDAIDLLTQAAELVADLHDRFLDAYVLPQLQGQEAGWLGEHAVDHLRNALNATRHPDQADA